MQGWLRVARWLVAGVAGCSEARGQMVAKAACAAPQEFAPKLTVNAGELVTLRCGAATAMEVIQAVGRQTRIPIGLVFGADAGLLTRNRRRYDLRGVSAESALLDAINGTGYTLRAEKGVLVLEAGDVTARAREVLGLRWAEFPASELQPMFLLGQRLTMWVRNREEPMCGVAGGGGFATNEEQVALPAMNGRSAEEIANALVRLGAHGMWTLQVPRDAPQSCSDPMSTFVVESYQHFGNGAVIAE